MSMYGGTLSITAAACSELAGSSSSVNVTASAYFFFFKQKTAYEFTVCWSSDVCSSDLCNSSNFFHIYPLYFLFVCFSISFLVHGTPS